MTAAQFSIFSVALPLVAARCGVTIMECDSSTRNYRVMFARHLLAYVLRHNAGLTLREIGLLMNRTTGSIHNSLRSLESYVQTDPARAGQVASVVGLFQSAIGGSGRPKS